MSAPGLPDDEDRRRRSPASAFTRDFGQEQQEDSAAGEDGESDKPAGDAERYESSHIGRGRKRISVDLDLELHERLQDALYYAQHHGEPQRTKVGTIQRGIELALAELREAHDVDEWPPREGGLRQGAPLGGH